jgi:hypothetical protein
MSEGLFSVTERIEKLEAAAKRGAAAKRLERAAAESRITPAQRETYGDHLVELSEPGFEWFLAEIEARDPAVRVDRVQKERERLDAAAWAYLRKHGMPDSDYRKALLAVSK